MPSTKLVTMSELSLLFPSDFCSYKTSERPELKESRTQYTVAMKGPELPHHGCVEHSLVCGFLQCTQLLESRKTTCVHHIAAMKGPELPHHDCVHVSEFTTSSCFYTIAMPTLINCWFGAPVIVAIADELIEMKL